MMEALAVLGETWFLEKSENYKSLFFLEKNRSTIQSESLENSKLLIV